MISLRIGEPNGDHLRILALGAHPDDVEIGAWGTIARLLEERPEAEVRLVVFSATPERAAEARTSAAALGPDGRITLTIHDIPDRLFPSASNELKAQLEAIASEAAPDLILAPRLEDRHQDHRALAEATWQSFRDHLVLEYEIPKYEGDLGTPNLFVPLSQEVVRRKLNHLATHFPSQVGRTWFDDEGFRAILRLRGIESAAPSGYAEAFTVRKFVV